MGDHFPDDYYKAIRTTGPEAAGELKENIETHLRRIAGAMSELSPAGPF